jgi:hopanoid biosynthesis associated protein HpnK
LVVDALPNSWCKIQRKIVINGDDFGHSHSVNQAIIRAHQDGVLTSASLMVTGEAFTEAIDLARQHPGLGIGLHLVVGMGRAVLPAWQIPHLVDASGQFPSDPLVVGLRYQFSSAARRELLLEIRAQLQRFKETGLSLSHVDGHLHNHVHPYVLRCLVTLAQEYGIRFIRLPYEELTVDWSTGSRPGPNKIILWSVFSLLRFYGGRLLSAHRIGYADRVYGLLHSGCITEEYLANLIPLIEANRVEIYAHPTLPGNDAPNHVNEGGDLSELQSLTSTSVRNLLEVNGFQRVTFSEL